MLHNVRTMTPCHRARPARARRRMPPMTPHTAPSLRDASSGGTGQTRCSIVGCAPREGTTSPTLPALMRPKMGIRVLLLEETQLSFEQTILTLELLHLWRFGA